MRLIERYQRLSGEKLLEKACSALPDGEWLTALIAHRKNGRNDYPIEQLWKGTLTYAADPGASLEQLGAPAASFSRFFRLIDRFSSGLDKLHGRVLDKIAAQEKGKTSLAIGYFGGVHLLWDALSGLPIVSEEAPFEGGGLKVLAKLEALSPSFFSCSQYLIGDPSYEELIEPVWETYRLKPIIPLKNQLPAKYFFRQASYDDQGTVYCNGSNVMVFAGFEEKRESLKYRCLARHYGISCDKKQGCPLWKGTRIPLHVNRKIFTPLPRSSYRWKALFKNYETQKALQAWALAFPKAQKALRIRLYSLLLLAASLADGKVGE